ncbi:MAG: hypothetical protein V6S10_06450 [Candidatus Methanoglobus sp.]
MLEDTLREYLGKGIVKVLESQIGREIATEIEKKMGYEDRKRVLREYERNGKLSEETISYLLSKFYFKDLTGILFGIPSDLQVYPEITQKMVGSGRFGVYGLRKHVRELGYPESKFEEILQAIYSEIEKLARDPKYLPLLTAACLEIGIFYLNSDYKKAEKFLLEAYDLRSHIIGTKRATRLLEAVIQLGFLYNRIKKTDRAEVMLDKASQLMEELAQIQEVDYKTANLLRELEKQLEKRQN